MKKMTSKYLDSGVAVAKWGAASNSRPKRTKTHQSVGKVAFWEAQGII